MVCRVVERDLGTPARTLDGHRPLEEVADSAIQELHGMKVAALSNLDEFKEANPHE